MDMLQEELHYLRIALELPSIKREFEILKTEPESKSQFAMNWEFSYTESNRNIVGSILRVRYL